MKWLFPLVALVLMALGIWKLTGVPAPEVHTRVVAFDNVYGTAERLTVHVKVDDGPEQFLTATCEPTMCSFKVGLTNARHVLTLSVEQDGKRSAPTQVTLDTSSR